MEEKQATLIERLQRVPSDARLIYAHDEFCSENIPVGTLCAEAAAALNQQAGVVVAFRKPETREEMLELARHARAHLAFINKLLDEAFAEAAPQPQASAEDERIGAWHLVFDTMLRVRPNLFENDKTAQQAVCDEIEAMAAALNAQAGVVEALRPLEKKLETYLQSCWTLTDSLMAIELAETARAALAASKGVES